MGRTVYGVDLEESPFGGLIEKLLTEEELEKLADGGAPGARGAAPDGGSDDKAGDDWTDAGADDGSDDQTDDEDWSVSDETYESSGDGDGESDDVESDTADDGADGSDSSGTSSWSPSSPPPSTARDDESGGYGSGSTYGESTGFGAGAGAGGYEGDDADDASFLSKHKWLLLKLAVAFAALAAVGVVIWRYKDRLAGVVPGRGGDDADEFDVDAPDGTGDDDADVSPARQRAKVDEGAPERDDDGATDRGDSDEEHETPRRRPPRTDEEGVETPGQDLDLGALVGLGVLTLVASLVRKYDEERNRPHDPLVDGPLDDGEDDVADDDQ